jgi:beta-galactosidase/beta-glucuronidase
MKPGWLVVTALVLSACGGAHASARPATPQPAPMAWAGPSGRVSLDAGWRVKVGRHGRYRAVSVPYSPNARHITSLASYRGSIAWYRRSFTVAGGDYAIRFESVNHRASVWIDGRRVARHTGDFLPFDVRVRLARGTHTLVVRADWRDPEQMRADGWFRSWFNYGGIDREVTLRRLAASELDSPGIVTRLSRGAARVTVTVRVRNRGNPRALRVTGTLGGTPLRFPAVRLANNRMAWVRATVTIPRPRLWSPAHPNLTALALAVPRESGYRAQVGLRELRWSGERLYLNGRRLELRGASLQEDAPGIGDALSPQQMDAIVARLKSIGANATRAQHALSEPLLERLDRAGILVWQEVGPFDVPGRWAATTPARRALALRKVRLGVLADRIHPSILTWSLINEVAFNGDPHGQRGYVAAGAAEARRLDPGRPIAIDVWGTHLPTHPGSIYRHVDMVGVTNYEGWYDDLWAPASTVDARIRALTERWRALFAGKVLVVTEFGAEANRANPTDAPGGLDFQARLLARHIRIYAADPHISGMLAWTLQDFALRPNFLGGSVRGLDRALKLHRGINAKGLFTYGGRPKPAAAVVRRAFSR